MAIMESALHLGFISVSLNYDAQSVSLIFLTFLSSLRLKRPASSVGLSEGLEGDFSRF